MPTRCTTCRHPALAEIDQALLQGEPHRNVSERYDLSASSVFRHSKQHLQAAPEADLSEAQDLHLADRVEALESLVSTQREVLLEVLRWFNEARRV